MLDESHPPENNTQPERQSRGQTGGVSIGNIEGGIHDSIIAGGDVTARIPNASDRPELRTQPPESADEYSLAAIRQLLLTAFTVQTLHRFCLDRPIFRPIASDFSPGQGLDDMVDKVINYCRTRLLWDELLLAVQQENPRQYTRFESELYGGDSN